MVFGFAAILNVTAPSPVPDAGNTDEIQSTLSVAVQMQPVPADLMVTFPLLAVGGRIMFAEVSVKLQGTPACVTTNGWPPIKAVAALD